MKGICTSQDKIDRFIELRLKGNSIKNISRITGSDERTISKYLKDNGIDTKKRTTIEKEQKVIELYRSGCSEEKVGEEVNLCKKTVRGILRNNNIPIRTPDEWLTKYPVKENYFDEINTQNKAYILGFFYADGNVNGKTKLQIGLQSDDLHILEKMKMEFGCIERPLTKNERAKYNSKHKDIWLLTIKNKRLHDGLVSKGVVPRKTKLLKYPLFLSDEMHRHFIRGVMDGDGCIHGTSSNDGHLHANVDIVGTLEMLNSIQKIIKEKVNVNSSIILSNKKSNVYKLTISGRLNCIKFLDWIYKDADMFLFRKYETYLSAYKSV